MASYPSNEIAEMSYTFWYRLSRHLTSPFASSDPIASLQVIASHDCMTLRVTTLCELLLPQLHET